MAPQWSELRDEAVSIVAAAETDGVIVRVVGSSGIRLHCGPPDEAMARLGRRAKDIDFVVPKEHRKGLRRLLESRGYLVDRDLLVAMEGRRYSFSHPTRAIEIDVFVENLEFNHVIEVRHRLRTHPVTIPIEDLLLQKLQIVKQAGNDILDAVVLISTHQVVDRADSSEDLDAGYIAGLLGRDWGFHHTAMRNLHHIRDAVGGTRPDAVHLDQESHEVVRARVDQLVTAIDAHSKTVAWRMRAKVGERMQWWQDVDDRVATY